MTELERDAPSMRLCRQPGDKCLKMSIARYQKSL